MEKRLSDIAQGRYAAPDTSLWSGRVDAEANGETWYWHQQVKPLDVFAGLPNGKNIVLLGCCTDEGVIRNQGRAGAARGPDAIRKGLAPLPHHLGKEYFLWDGGNILQPDRDLEKSHEEIQQLVKALIAHKCFPVVLGGGHDLAYPHYQGIKQASGASSRIGIINLDAHLDLRHHPIRNSGTPFYQIALNHPGEFHYLCLGIQKFSNTPFHFQRANQLGVRILMAEDFQLVYWENIERVLAEFMGSVDLVYLTIDMDGFASSVAPGVSAPSSLGFTPEVVLPTLAKIASSGKLISMDVVECNPEFDIDQRTARLAARVIAHTLASKD